MSKKKMMKKMAIIGLAASVSMSNLSSIAAAGIETIPGNVKVLSVNATDTKASISNDEGRSKKAFEVTKAEFQDSTEKYFEVDLSNCELENGDTLLAGVWSDANGQDDLKWITLVPQNGGTYHLSIKISDFKSHGLYYVHIYRKQKDGSKSCVAGLTFKVSEISSGTMKLQEQVYEEGKAEIKITGVKAPSGIKKIRVAVWSDPDQNDIYWYSAEKRDDSWYVDMDITKYHKNNWNNSNFPH